METKETKTFIIDCPSCKAKVAAYQTGFAEKKGWIEGPEEPYGQRVFVGTCPICRSILVGESIQIAFEDYDSDEDRWSDVVRVFPNPTKTFYSIRIPRVVKDSLNEAERSMQANANIAACVMFGRALEAVCRDVLKDIEQDENQNGPSAQSKSEKRMMLGIGIQKLREKNIIDDRLYNWSQQLQAFRNLAAHPDDIKISRDDIEDLKIFVYTIVEYIYDLTDRYDEFIERIENRKKQKSSSGR